MNYDSEYAPRTHVHEALDHAQAEMSYLNAELVQAYDRADTLIALLEDCRDLLAGYADADIDAAGVHPNQAMRLWNQINEVLR